MLIIIEIKAVVTSVHSTGKNKEVGDDTCAKKSTLLERDHRGSVVLIFTDTACKPSNEDRL